MARHEFLLVIVALPHRRVHLPVYGRDILLPAAFACLRKADFRCYSGTGSPNQSWLQPLQGLPTTMAREAVIQCEILYKEKLGWRTVGAQEV